MARRANKPPHLCYMSHPTMGEETKQSLSTVGRGIEYLKRRRYIQQVPSAPKLRRLGIRTYRLLVDGVDTGHSAASDKSTRREVTSQDDRKNLNESKENLRERPKGRRSRKGREAYRIGELIIRLGDTLERGGESPPANVSNRSSPGPGNGSQVDEERSESPS